MFREGYNLIYGIYQGERAAIYSSLCNPPGRFQHFAFASVLPYVGREVRLGGGDRPNLFLVVVNLVKDTHEGSAALGTGSSIPAALVDGTVWLERTLLVQ